MPPRKKIHGFWVVFLGGLGGGGLKGNLDGVDVMAALFKESLCICSANLDNTPYFVNLV